MSTLTTDSSPTGGPDLDSPRGMAFLPNGDIVMTDDGPTNGARPIVVEVNPGTGVRTLISGDGTGSGPELSDPYSVAVEADGDILVAAMDITTGYPQLLRISPATGNRTVLSDDVTPSGGQQFNFPVAVKYNACDKAFYVMQTGLTSSTTPGKVLKVDAATGARTLFAKFQGAENYAMLLRPIAVQPPATADGGASGG